MRGPTHELIGVSAAVVASRGLQLDPVQTAGLAACAFATSRLPDRIEPKLPAWVTQTRGMHWAAHRHLSHWALTCVLITALAGFVALMLAGAVIAGIVAGGTGIGYGMHLVADSCTPHGTPALAPFHRECVWLLPRGYRIRTGSGVETLLATLILAGLLFLLYRAYGAGLLNVSGQ